MKVNFNKDVFNPLFWHLQKYSKDSNIRYIFIQGGSSAAKTYTVVQKNIIDTMQDKIKAIVLRKYGSDIEDSIYSDFSTILSDWNLRSIFICIKNRIKNAVGGGIRFRGLDDSEKIKGIAGFDRVIMEEMSQFDEDDFKQIRKRLRGKENQQIWGLWNPVSEQHWLKKNVLDKYDWYDLPLGIEGVENSTLDSNSFVKMNTEGNAIYIKTTYLDNYYINGHPTKSNVGYKDEHVIADFEQDRKFDYEYYRVYALGEWGKLDTGAEFYKNFNVEYNVSKSTGYNSSLPLHLCFDENVNPYLACSIWQADGLKVWQIDEVALESPANTLEHTCTEIKKRYKDHTNGMFIYGDATSKKADTKLQKGQNFFSLIVKYLDIYQPKTRVPLSNPSIMLRGLFINRIFIGLIDDVSVIIGDNCKRTIEDLRYTKEASDGTKLKEKTKNSKTGVTFEQYGHFSDTVDYFLTEYFKQQYNTFQYGDYAQKRVALKPSNPINY